MHMPLKMNCINFSDNVTVTALAGPPLDIGFVWVWCSLSVSASLSPPTPLSLFHDTPAVHYPRLAPGPSQQSPLGDNMGWG